MVAAVAVAAAVAVVAVVAAVVAVAAVVQSIVARANHPKKRRRKRKLTAWVPSLWVERLVAVAVEEYWVGKWKVKKSWRYIETSHPVLFHRQINPVIRVL